MREKEKSARNEQFLLFPHCFLPFWRTSVIFIKLEIVISEIFQAESKIVCLSWTARPTIYPPTQKIILRFRGGKIFLSFAAKTSDSMPGIWFESHMLGSSMHPSILTKSVDIHRTEKNCINEREIL